MGDKKIRLDRLLVEKGLVQSRERARARIMAGDVLVNRFPVDKPGTLVESGACVALRGQDLPYVSRGGLKLAAALEALSLDIRDFNCMDVGASTGGFTDCLLQHGAHRVFAVDVGYGQLAWKLRQDTRVVVMERTNIRHLPAEGINGRMDLITIDVSFISLKIVVPAAMKFLKPEAAILALIKPQFEVGRALLGKGGVVRDTRLHSRVIRELGAFFSELGLSVGPVIPSPVEGPKGNREFLILLQSTGVRDSHFSP
jgi:23S rRNA (cytidine1920-2'-O)/16S rRNA (cytidine1409-2'-O)-methyltransferase